MEPILDPLYGIYDFQKEIAELIRKPPVQRLRDIRMSNIDSVEMPGISNISRYEHSLGTAYLASVAGVRKRISSEDLLIFQAAALLHDTAIPPFGHIVEEAWSYIGQVIDHEHRWTSLLAGESSDQPGGVNLQLFYGRQSGLREWAYKIFGMKETTILQQIVEAILGQGKFGPSICGELDVDNLDNVLRAAFHMGLDIDKHLSPMIAQGIVNISPEGEAIFSEATIPFITEWLKLRREVYEHFMTSESDFAGKVMLIHAIIHAHKSQTFTESHWNLTDREFISLLLRSENKTISDTIERWLLGERWTVSDLIWFDGNLPNYQQIYSFSGEVTKHLGRECLAYRIKDKRHRKIQVTTENGQHITLGDKSTLWLLGVSSPVRTSFTRKENHAIIQIARDSFGSEAVGEPSSHHQEPQPTLL